MRPGCSKRWDYPRTQPTHDGGGASSYLTRVWHLATGVRTCISSAATTSKSVGGGASCIQPRAVAAPPRYKSANGGPPLLTDHRSLSL